MSGRLDARISLGGHEVGIDVSQPVSLALVLDFSGPQPRHFGAPPASARPFEVADFRGSVQHGASCNCDVISLIPHCNGTHTECVGHLTRERLDASRVVPLGFVPGLLLSVTPEPALDCGEDSTPAPHPGDRLITRRALEQSWRRSPPVDLPTGPRALIVRTLPNDAAKRTRDYSQEPPPFLSRQAAQLLVASDIQHLVVDLPSIDRTHDEGHLLAHRIFFGLPAGSTRLADATRPTATVTELAFVPDEVRDGVVLLSLQVPALSGDAVPSRPLVYPLLS